MPPVGDLSCINRFAKLVTDDLHHLKKTNRKLNLRKEIQALRSLETVESIVIKASNNGGNVVILERTDYIKMCLNILDNRDRYD